MAIMKSYSVKSNWLLLFLSITCSTINAAQLGVLTYEVTTDGIVITDCDQSATDVEVPDTIGVVPVTGIGGSAFLGCRSLTSITIPESVTSIDNRAFLGCPNLTSIHLPNSFQSPGEVHRIGVPMGIFPEIEDSPLLYRIVFGEAVLESCDSQAIGAIKIRNQIASFPVTTIANEAFLDCRNIISVFIPGSVSSVGFKGSFGGGTFFGCSRLVSVNIPDSVTRIGSYSFGSCHSLLDVTIPDSVTSIGSGAFFGCHSLTSITIPESVTSLGGGAFEDCFALERIVVRDIYHSRAEASRIGIDEIYPWGFYLPPYNQFDNKPSIRMAPVIMVQGEEGNIKTIEVSNSPDGPWRFWMTVTATESGVAITDLDDEASKRFYRVTD